MAEESSTQASISRIIMLVEALFEVLTFSHAYCLLLALIQFSCPPFFPTLFKFYPSLFFALYFLSI